MSSDHRTNGASRTLAVRARLARQKGGFELDVDFTLEPGITVVFGPSGSGKSTILGVIAGLLKPDAGRVALGEELWFDSTARKAAPIHARRVALVFQSLALFPHMTASANVEFGIDRSVARADRRAKARASLERFRAAHLAERKPRTFSGGEGQRVALARAFAMGPRVLLLDEPFSALDQAMRAEFCRDLRAFADELSIPILHVTHDRAEARELADRVLLIERGRIVSTGTAADLLGGDSP